MIDLLPLLAWGPGGWGDELAAGAMVTVALALATLPFGVLLGFLVALARNSGVRELERAAAIFTTIFRGLPELLTIFIVYFGGQFLVSRVASVFTDSYVELSSFVAGMIALGLVFAAFSSEVFLGCLRAIPSGQAEAGQSLGLSKRQVLRTVTMPQLVRLALPGLSNLWLILLKETSLVSVIALDELVRTANIINGAVKEPFFVYGTMCLIFLLLTGLSAIGIRQVEEFGARGMDKAGMGAMK